MSNLPPNTQTPTAALSYTSFFRHFVIWSDLRVDSLKGAKPSKKFTLISLGGKERKRESSTRITKTENGADTCQSQGYALFISWTH